MYISIKEVECECLYNIYVFMCIDLMLWDCLEEMKKIPNWSVDAIITDPPYWTTSCKWDNIIPFDKMWIELKRIIKPNWAIVLFWSEPFSSYLRCSNIKDFRYDIIWEKESPTNFLWCKKTNLKSSWKYIIVLQKTTNI